MNIYTLSDLHLEFSAFKPDPDAAKAADVVVLAGDIHLGVNGITWARKTFPNTPVVYVAGNHEFYGHHWDRLPDLLRQEAHAMDVHFLENDCVTIDGVKFLGATLWTDFEYHGLSRRSQCMHEVERCRMDYQDIKAETIQPEVLVQIMNTQGGNKSSVRWSRKLTAVHTLARHQASLAWLKSELAANTSSRCVVVSHHYPNQKSTASRYARQLINCGFGSKLPVDMLAQADLWIHGHTHDSFDYRLHHGAETVRVVCNPRGYPLFRITDVYENANFNSRLLLHV